MAKLNVLELWKLECDQIKEDAKQNRDLLLKQFKDSIEENDGKFYLANSIEEFERILKGIVDSEKIVVKTRLADKIDHIVSEILKNKGNGVLDLDASVPELAEQYLDQIKNDGRYGSNKHKIETISDINSIDLKLWILDKLKTVQIGITSAHTLAAESGSVIFYENDAHMGFTSFLSEKHIVIGFVENLYFNILDALKVAWLDVANKEEAPSYIQIIQGPSKTGDIEKKIVKPSHGPMQFYVVLLNIAKG